MSDGQHQISRPDATVLGRIMIAEGMIPILTDEKHIAEFTIPAIEKVPGVHRCGMCLGGVPYNLDEKFREYCILCERPEVPSAPAPCIDWIKQSPGIKLVIMETSSYHLGFAFIEVSSPDQFFPYEPFIRNFLNFCTVNLENRRQREELSQANRELIMHRESLEETVREKTASLLESESRYRTIVETANEGIWSIDRDQKTTFTNQRFAQMMGYSPEEMLGRKVESFIFAEDLPDHRANMALRSSLKDQKYERRFKCKDGREIWTIVSAKALQDENGEFAGSFAMFTDITQRKIIERALKASEAKFRKTFNNAPILMSISEVEGGRYLEVNDHFCRVSGFSRSEAVGKTSVELGWISAADRKALAGELMSSGKISEKQIKMKTKDGRPITCLYKGVLFALEDKRYLISIALDITDRLSRELRYGQIMRTATDGIWQIDKRGIIVDVNPAGAELLGYSVAELKGRNLTELDPRNAPEQIDLRFKHLLAHGSAFFETQHRRKDGRLVDVEVSARRLPVEEGGFVAFVRDISQRKQAEKELMEAQERFRTAFLTSPDASCINRLSDGSYLEVNEGFLADMGYNREEVIGKSTQALNIWVNLEDRKKLLAGLEKDGYYYNLEAQFRRKDGTISTGLMSARVIRMGGEPHLISVTRDINKMREVEREQTRLREQLQQAQKMDALGTLASGIAHDFNNILAAIMGYAELAQDELPDDHPIAQDIAEITKATARAKKLIRQILTFSRKKETNQRPISLNKTISDFYAILKRTMPKMMDLDLRLDGELPPIKADPQQIEQILLNLATNAQDAMGETGSIVITTRAASVHKKLCSACGQYFSGEYAVLSVRDTGAGISPEIRKKIFEPFFTTKEIGKGTGLGLATVFGIVANHGGHIECTSREGDGTSFDIYLPWARDTLVRNDHDLAGALGRTGGKERIMVVDDEASVREIASKMLTRGGYQVITADSGEQALEMYRQRQEDLDAVVLDLGMPGMGGKACLVEIKKLDPKAKVVITSGYIQYELTDELKELGAWGMVAKPYAKADLLKSLRTMFEETSRTQSAH